MRYLIGDAVLDLDTFEFRRAGHVIHFQRRMFDVLIYLVENRGRVVSRSELLDACWPDAIVGDASLSSCIRKLRRAFSDSGRESRVIRTVHGRGYWFVGSLRTSASEDAERTKSQPHHLSLAGGTGTFFFKARSGGG